ncbi:TRAFAC clade GTPase domain-containing protein [Roseivirga sp.]|uniref:TRAFAC clade GTPase domain-containing protein n=1 Tax=Roseivirga sp. TaxID=1964215 RepID=UPI003B5224AE
MARRQCSKEDCHAPQDFCQELGSPEYPKCKHFIANAHKEEAKVTSKKNKTISTIPWSGDFLQQDEIDLLAHRGTPKIIGLIGSSGAGKTTYLAMLYTLLFNGKLIEGWDFAGSYTLSGWELQAKTLHIKENGKVRYPDATPSDKDFQSLYHLALRNENHLHDVLFADSSGEVFSKWADNVDDPSAENAGWIYEKSHGFLFFIDCQAIIDQRGRAKLEIVQLAEQVKKGLNKRPIVLLWSKADLADSMRSNIVESIETSLKTLFPDAISLQISNYSKSDSDELCHVNNLKGTESLLNQMDNPQPLTVAPMQPESSDFFFKYRGSYGSK